MATKKKSKKKTSKRTAGQASQRASVLTMTKEDLERQPGAQLLYVLFQHANRQGWNLAQLAEQLGVTYSYLSQLRSGTRYIKHISDDLAHAIAQVLGMSVVEVRIASGLIKPEDFYQDPESVVQRVREGIDIVMRDPAWSKLAPGKLVYADYEMQRLVVLLYEQATGRKILPSSAEQDELIKFAREYSK